MLLGGLGVVAVVLATIWVEIWVEEGEVATLVTFDSKRHAIHTDVSIVDVEGPTYVRAADAETDWLAADPDTDWLERLLARPEVQLRRDGMVSRVRGVPSDDPAVREAVNRAMRRKYGSVDRVVAWVRDRSRCVPVWLEPLSSTSR
jgi:hypothetical protein